jgi:hypothetical protein
MNRKVVPSPAGFQKVACTEELGCTCESNAQNIFQQPRPKGTTCSGSKRVFMIDVAHCPCRFTREAAANFSASSAFPHFFILQQAPFPQAPPPTTPQLPMSSSNRSHERSCHVCQDMNPDLAQLDRITILDLQKSTQDGCAGCSVLESIIMARWPGYKLTDTSWWRFCDGEDTLTVELFYRPNRFVLGDGKLVARLELWTLTGELLDEVTRKACVSNQTS